MDRLAVLWRFGDSETKQCLCCESSENRRAGEAGMLRTEGRRQPNHRAECARSIHLEVIALLIRGLARVRYENVGTAFPPLNLTRIGLPDCQGMDTPVNAAPPKILVVDDDPEVREIVAETLVEFGYGVVQAGSGEEALPMLDRRPDIGLVITDVRMPGMSGLELVELAQARSPTLKVIVISGYFLPQPISVRFLKKPFHMHELASAVRAELG